MKECPTKFRKTIFPVLDFLDKREGQPLPEKKLLSSEQYNIITNPKYYFLFNCFGLFVTLSDEGRLLFEKMKKINEKSKLPR